MARVPVLMYHELLAPGALPLRAEPGYTRYVVTRDDFRAHLDILRVAGRTGCAVGDLLDAARADRVVALSFDDGCASDLAVAAPLLDAFGFRATFYLTTAWLGTPGFLTEADVRELAQRFEIGSHSVSHAYLSDLDDAPLHKELAESKDRLEQIAGSPVRHLSCPGGRWSTRVAGAARAAGYISVADSRPVPHRVGGNVLRIGRFAVFDDTTPAHVQQLVTRGASGRARLRAAALDSARAILGNRRYDRVRRALMERGRS